MALKTVHNRPMIAQLAVQDLYAPPMPAQERIGRLLDQIDIEASRLFGTPVPPMRIKIGSSSGLRRVQRI